MDKKEALYNLIDRLSGYEIHGTITSKEKEILEGAKKEVAEIETKEQVGVEAERHTRSREMKQRRGRGKSEEYVCAKKTKGVVVGRSKAVNVNGKWYQTDCQKPPDVLTPPYSFEVKNQVMPKRIVSAMSQAVGNSPPGLTPKVWWRDRTDGIRYVIELMPDFLDDHIG